MKHPWMFEPCSPEGATDPLEREWPHAVKGAKPGGRSVVGYGYTEPQAYDAARDAAERYDAREVMGERGEVKPVTLAKSDDALSRWLECMRRRV